MYKQIRTLQNEKIHFNKIIQIKFNNENDKNTERHKCCEVYKKCQQFRLSMSKTSKSYLFSIEIQIRCKRSMKKKHLHPKNHVYKNDRGSWAATPLLSNQFQWQTNKLNWISLNMHGFFTYLALVAQDNANSNWWCFYFMPCYTVIIWFTALSPIS